MLRVDLRQLRHGPVDTRAELAPDDPAFAGLGLELAEPVRVTGRLQATGDGEYFWHGAIRSRARGECRRCLTPVDVAVEAEVEVLFSADPDAADDPSVYPLAPDAAAVELGEAVREEMALSAPAYLLCRDDCAGLCPHCGADLNAGACRCARTAEPS